MENFKKLEHEFRNFLIAKGYPPNSLIFGSSISSSKSKVIRADITIIDIETDNFIAVVEFTNNIYPKDKLLKLRESINNYILSLGEIHLDAFVILPSLFEEFEIYTIDESGDYEIKIEKEYFPTYEALVNKKNAQDKLLDKKQKEESLNEIKEKKKRNVTASYFAIASIFFGMLFSITLILINNTESKDKKKNNLLITDCCDSLYNETKYLKQNILLLERKINLIVKDSISKNKDTVYTSKDLLSYKKRLEIVEQSIMEKPEKVLTLLQLKSEIEQLRKADEFNKELMQAKVDAVKETLQYTNSFLYGALLTIAGSILSFAIPNLVSNNNRTEP